MASRYAWALHDPSAPGIDIVPITPDDAADIQTAASNGDTIIGVRALRATSAGTIAVIMANGQTRSLEFAAGETRVGLFTRVLNTGTTVNTDSAGTGIEGHL